MPIYEPNETHDPTLESWVESANDPAADFPIQNLPFGLKQADIDSGNFEGEYPEDYGAMLEEIVAPIGDRLLNISLCADHGLLEMEERFDDDLEIFISNGQLQALANGDHNGLEPGFLPALRRAISNLLHKDNPRLRDDKYMQSQVLHDPDDVQLIPPLFTHDYTDFYASAFHATNVGSMFRPDNPLLPNYKWMPIAYHGRASTLILSGTPIIRPAGQQAPTPESEGRPSFGPCKMLDYELEVGLYIGRAGKMGRPITIAEAEEHIFGMCLVNDWSARDIQKWEYQPLGPFLAKNFATTISPYIVTMEALAPFRTAAFTRPEGDPAPLPHLDSDDNRAHGGVDITLEVHLSSQQMRERGMDPVHLSTGKFRDMYWTIAQMVTHHTAGGCAMQAGDLLASGTISGTRRDSRGCLLELTWDGDPWSDPPKIVPGAQRTPISLPTGEKRTFLADGDEVILRGYCQRDGYRRIGFGSCRGVIQAAAAAAT